MQALLVLSFATFTSVNSQFFNPILNGFFPFPEITLQIKPENIQQPNIQQFNPERPSIYQNNPFLNQHKDPQIKPQNDQEKPTLLDDRLGQSNTVRPVATSSAPVNNIRISEQKCKEYQTAGQPKKNVTFVGGTDFSKPVAIKSDGCYASQGLIVGGTNASAGEFPHMVAVGFRNLNNELSFDCGGSIISERFVLTAAHCRYSRRIEASVIRVGDLNLKVKEPKLPELDVPIESFIIHERYDGANKKNDIAVVRLARDVEFNKFVRPACLMTKNSFPQNKAIASGWGSTDPYYVKRADNLQKIELSLIGYRDCSQNYNKHSNYNLDSTQLCAGDAKGGKDTCGGDSGGPLQIVSKETSCAYTIIGVTSYGNSYCGAEKSAGVYTKVSAYIDWIEQKVWGS